MADAHESMEAEVTIVYTNWRGQTDTRRIAPRPGTLRFEATEHHPDPQWVFDAFDLDKKADRTFALKDVHSWKAANV